MQTHRFTDYNEDCIIYTTYDVNKLNNLIQSILNLKMWYNQFVTNPSWYYSNLNTWYFLVSFDKMSLTNEIKDMTFSTKLKSLHVEFVPNGNWIINSSEKQDTLLLISIFNDYFWPVVGWWHTVFHTISRWHHTNTRMLFILNLIDFLLKV